MLKFYKMLNFIALPSPQNHTEEYEHVNRFNPKLNVYAVGRKMLIVSRKICAISFGCFTLIKYAIDVCACVCLHDSSFVFKQQEMSI